MKYVLFMISLTISGFLCCGDIPLTELPERIIPIAPLKSKPIQIPLWFPQKTAVVQELTKSFFNGAMGDEDIEESKERITPEAGKNPSPVSDPVSEITTAVTTPIGSDDEDGDEIFPFEYDNRSSINSEEGSD